jgi:DNA polymerase IV
MTHSIIHIDITDFPIAVERVMEPRLRQRPVAVAVETTTRALVCAVSEEARQAGVYRGMALHQALRECPDLHVLPPNEELYRRATLAMMEIIGRFTPIYEPLRFGHAYLDMTGVGRLFGPVRDAAAVVQKEIRRQLRLGASAGVAVNKLVSKVASDFVTAGGERFGLYDVRRGDEKPFLAPLSIHYLPGVHQKVHNELRDLNIRIIRELAAVHVEHLQTAFGRFGLLLHQRAHGIDPRPVQPPKKVPEIVELEQLDEDSNDYFFLRARLHSLLATAARRLRDQRLRAGRLVVEIRYSDQKDDAAQQRFAPVDTEIELASILRGVFERALSRRVRVRRLTLRLCDLSSLPRQLSLFAAPVDAKIAAVTFAMDKIRDRFGERAIRFGRAA